MILSIVIYAVYDFSRMDSLSVALLLGLDFSMGQTRGENRIPRELEKDAESRLPSRRPLEPRYATEERPCPPGENRGFSAGRPFGPLARLVERSM